MRQDFNGKKVLLMAFKHVLQVNNTIDHFLAELEQQPCTFHPDIVTFWYMVSKNYNRFKYFLQNIVLKGLYFEHF